MKTASKIPITVDIPAAKTSHNQRLIEAKAIAASSWTPQPNPLTREEIRRLVIEQIG